MKRTLLTLLVLASCVVLTAEPNKVIPASQILERLDAEIIYDKTAVGKDLTVEEEKEVARQTRQIPLSSIQFKQNSTELADQASYTQIRELATALADPALHDSVITLEGHTCDLGKSTDNAALSLRRAQAVRNILVQLFNISDHRILTVGKGEDIPIVNNTDEASRSQNRRVTIVREPNYNNVDSDYFNHDSRNTQTG